MLFQFYIISNLSRWMDKSYASWTVQQLSKADPTILEVVKYFNINPNLKNWRIAEVGVSLSLFFLLSFFSLFGSYFFIGLDFFQISIQSLSFPERIRVLLRFLCMHQLVNLAQNFSLFRSLLFSNPVTVRRTCMIDSEALFSSQY